MNGPMKMRAEKKAIVILLVSFPNKSEKAPPTTANGHDTKTPAKNRESNSICKSFAVVAANMKHVNTKYAL